MGCPFFLHAHHGLQISPSIGFSGLSYPRPSPAGKCDLSPSAAVAVQAHAGSAFASPKRSKGRGGKTRRAPCAVSTGDAA